MAITDDKYIIKSVIGFDLNVRVTYKNDQGEELPICKGCRSVPYTGNEHARIGVSNAYKKFFTNFNQELLDKIKDYKSKNC